MITNFSKYNESLFLSNDEWIEKCIDYAKKYGAIETNYMGFDFKIDTKVGKLYFIVSGGFSLWSRFEEPKRASQLVGCNINSGKWNYFSLKSMDFWYEFKRRVDEIKLSDVELTTIKYNM